MKNLLLRGLAPEGVFRVQVQSHLDQDCTGSLSGPSPLLTKRWALTLLLRPSRDFGRSSVVPTSRDVGGRLFTLTPRRFSGRYLFCDTIRCRQLALTVPSILPTRLVRVGDPRHPAQARRPDSRRSEQLTRHFGFARGLPNRRVEFGLSSPPDKSGEAIA